MMAAMFSRARNTRVRPSLSSRPLPFEGPWLIGVVAKTNSQTPRPQGRRGARSQIWPDLPAWAAHAVLRRLGHDAALSPAQIVRLLSLPSVTHQTFANRRCVTSFFYITGFNYPDCAVTYDVSSDSSTLWIPYVEPRQALYFGSPPDPAKIKAKYDVDHVKYTDELASYLRKELGSKTVYLLHPTQLSDLHLKSISGHCGIDTSSLLPAMNRARVVKTPYEIAMIRKACAVSALGHRRIMQHLLRMTNEREIQAVFEAVCTSRGARDLAYGTIVGAGENGATLHYDDNDQPLGSKATVVVDAGCEWAGYASDITRTLPLAGRFEGRAAEIHGIVQLMQDCCIKEARTGQPYRQLHLLAAHIAIDGLHTLGILKGDKEEIRRQGTIGAFFPHGLGHHVGLEVHDVSGDLPLLAAGANSGHHLRATKRCFLGPDELSALDRVSGAESRPVSKLEPGMVVTIEPGMYVVTSPYDLTTLC